MTKYDSLRAQTKPGQRNGKAGFSRKAASLSYWRYNRKARLLIEGSLGHNQDVTFFGLLATKNRIQIDDVNVTLFHNNSRPTAGASTHSRSASGAFQSH